MANRDKKDVSWFGLATKKAKLDDLDWGEDLDGDLIDDCFRRATQQNPDDPNDVTLLPSYSIFKQPHAMLTSTQDPVSLEGRLQELHDKYAEKEGEVSILRTNLKDLRTSCQAEQERKYTEWNDKLNTYQKDNKAIKSELDFKNLEVANLKQQILELTKLLNAEQNFTQKTHNVSNTPSPIKSVKEIAHNHTKIQINCVTYYPLKSMDFSFLFKTHHEQNFQTLNCNNEKKIDLDYVRQELLQLIILSEHELDSLETIPIVNKVVLVSLQLLLDFYSQIKRIGDDLQLEQVEESDSLHLQTSRNSKQSILGIAASNLIAFLSELLPFNTYLRTYMLLDRPLDLKSSVYPKSLLNLVQEAPKFYYLTLLTKTINNIGKTRQECVCSDYLCATTSFLCKIFTTQCVNEEAFEVVKELLFVKPEPCVVFNVTSLLKIATSDLRFNNLLCSQPGESVTNTIKGVLYFNRESCRFHMYAILFENALSSLKEASLLRKISLNVFSFVHNLFMSNCDWLYPEANKRCECLLRLYKMVIGLIDKNLTLYNEDRSATYPILFKNGIKILHLLTFNSFDLNQKYVRHFAQFKDIVYSLTELADKLGLDELDKKNLENLNVSEDLPEASYRKFAEIEL